MMTSFAPGSAEERARFAELQSRLRPMFERVFPDRTAARTVVIVPALALDAELLANITGVEHYEERLLCMLLLLRLPRTRVVYVTSTPVDPTIVDYYLHLLPGVPHEHARERLTLLSCHDNSVGTVTEKLLTRPRLLERLRCAIGDPNLAHMTCFNVTPAERTLAVRLGIPIFGNDPALSDLGTKSGSREVFAAAGVEAAPGFERLRDAKDIVESLSELKRRDPGLRRAVVKHEEGTSGEGNAVFRYDDAPSGAGLAEWIGGELPERLAFEAPNEDFDHYVQAFERTGGIVEAWIEGDDKRSPSVQGRVDPLGRVEVLSTHDQVLGGPSGQVFKGSYFPADERYRSAIHEMGARVGDVLRDRGALGRYGVDFVSVPQGDGWRHVAIEINLRKGGTTHTYRVLQFLTNGTCDPDTGLFHTSLGAPRFYRATDNLTDDLYRRLTPRDLIDVALERELLYTSSTQTGVFFHLMGGIARYGKLGLVAVGESPDAAQSLYDATVRALADEAGANA